jgi:predicted enzyme related to lactoylglutathione lyase
MPTIVHFEIPSDDIQRSKRFYNELFGWTIEKFQGTDNNMPEDMEYYIITTTDEKGDKALRGGMLKRHNVQQQGIINYIDVKSIDEYSTKVEKIGGKVVVQKMPVPGMGYFAICLDTENNSFAIWETNSSAK